MTVTKEQAQQYGEANRIEGGDGWQLMADFANAKRNRIEDIIAEIRLSGFGLKLDCWKDGGWAVRLWKGSPVDQSEVIKFTGTGHTLLDALLTAKKYLGQEQK